MKNIRLFRRTYFVKDTNKPTVKQRAGARSASMIHADELVSRYGNIFEARKALTWFQDNAEGCSYYLKYPQPVKRT